MRRITQTILILLISSVNSFPNPSFFKTFQNKKNTQSTPSSLSSTTPPTWSELTTRLSSPTPTTSTTPQLTLYRDTNGWCPFCERVWFALHIKKIPYKESLINLQDKPAWFLDLVPTGLVPAVVFHESEGETSRSLVWESYDILKALDERFPETEPLVLETNDEYKTAKEICGNVTTAGFKLSYGGRNETLTDADRVEIRAEFERRLGDLDEYLGRTDGPFLLGERVTGVDVEIVPILERWRYQLPLMHGIDITSDRKNIERWYEGLDSLAAYSERVRGDEYSWTAVASTFLRIFSSPKDGVTSEDTLAKIKTADEAAEKLRYQFSNDLSNNIPSRAYHEAVAKLVSNHEAVVADCTRTDPVSQKELTRASAEEASASADLALRAVADALSRESVEVTVPNFDSREGLEAARVALGVVAARLCVPRDMGGEGARVLRGVLARLAEELEGVAVREEVEVVVTK